MSDEKRDPESDELWEDLRKAERRGKTRGTSFLEDALNACEMDMKNIVRRNISRVCHHAFTPKIPPLGKKLSCCEVWRGIASMVFQLPGMETNHSADIIFCPECGKRIER